MLISIIYLAVTADELRNRFAPKTGTFKYMPAYK